MWEVGGERWGVGGGGGGGGGEGGVLSPEGHMAYIEARIEQESRMCSKSASSLSYSAGIAGKIALNE